MADRERLIELILNCERVDLPLPIDYQEHLADHLLANGVIVPPCKVGVSVWFLLEDDFPEHRWFLSEERVTDVSKKGFFVSGFTPPEDDLANFTPWADVGKEAFFSKDAAETAQKEREAGAV